MKKIAINLSLALTLFVCSFTLSAQNDVMHFHNGKTIDANVLKLDDFKIIYKYAGENAEQTVSKLAVSKIIYSSGREEEVSEKIEINGVVDWEKVEVLMDLSEIVGLKKVGDVTGKTTGFFSGYTTAGGTDKRSLKKLLEAAAEMNCPFIYMTADKDASSAGGGIGLRKTSGSQSIKKGVAYTY